MRGSAYPAPRRSTVRLLSSAATQLAGWTALLLALVTVTGGTASPLVAGLAAALILLVRNAPRPLLFAAPWTVAGVLLLHASLARGLVGRDVLVTLILLASTIPGLVWRRERRQRHALHADIDASLDHARRRGSVEPDPAEEVADLERALGAVAARVGAHNVILWDVDGYRGVARARAAAMARPPRPITLAGDPLGWVWDQGMRLRLERPPAWAPAGLTVVAERLRRHDESGMLATYAFEQTRMPSDDLAFEESAVYLRGVIALQEARARTAASQHRVDALLTALDRMPADLDLESFARGMCDTAIAVTGATGAALGMWSAAAEHGQLLAVVGPDGGPAAGDIFEPPASELALSIRAEAPLLRDAADWRIGRTHLARPDEPWTARPRSLAVLPLHGAKGPIGALAVWSSVDPQLDAEAVALLGLLSPYAAQHIEHAREFGRMRENAEQDPLTKLLNRRAFDEVFSRERGRFERYGRPLSLLMLDLDHFKAINDRFGHEAGDEVLRAAAAAAASCVRDIDTAARLGGEEFVVLLPETGVGAALEVAERIRTAISALEVSSQGRKVPVTVSIGVATSPEHVGHPQQLVSAADAALYRAKSAGRNRVEQARNSF